MYSRDPDPVEYKIVLTYSSRTAASLKMWFPWPLSNWAEPDWEFRVLDHYRYHSRHHHRHHYRLLSAVQLRMRKKLRRASFAAALRLGTVHEESNSWGMVDIRKRERYPGD